MRLLIFVFLIIASFLSVAQLEPIILDETFNEWTQFEDIANTSNEGNLTIKAANTDEYLFMYFEIEDVISIQSDERIILHLDTDNNSSTGMSINGIGAELRINFGERSVTSEFNGTTYTTGFRSIGMIIMPTVWSNKYELAFDRDAMVSGNAVFTGSAVRAVLEDNASEIFSPAASGGAIHTFADYSFDELPAYSISKLEENQLRFMSHNVHFDDLFEASYQPSFRRMYQAIKPDIIGFQEIYDHDGATVAALMDDWLPLPDGATWYGSDVNDNVVVSKYPITGTFEANNFGNGAFRISLQNDFGTDLLMINAHTPCCDNDAGRQDEIDAIMAFVRDAKAGNGALSISENTPIILMGDFNLVGDPQNTNTLLTGDIQNESKWGSDFAPDWNGKDFIDAMPIVSGSPMRFTHWSSFGAGRFSYGKLDAIIYSGSGMTLENTYVMHTESMSSSELTALGLLENDSEGASDHLPMISDYTITADVVNNEVPLLSIRNNNSEGISEYLAQVVTVSGVISVDEEFGENLSFLQDNDVGIAIFGSQFEDLFSTGDSVTVTGEIDEFRGLTELVFSSVGSAIIHKSDVELSPSATTISDINGQNWDGAELIEGTLVKLLDVKIDEAGIFSESTDYTISDGTSSMVLRIDSNTDLIGEPIPTGLVEIVGIVSQFDDTSPYNSGYQILPRSKSDLFAPFESIAEVRINDDSGVPILESQLVTVSGVVTVSNTFGKNGIGYMQDDKSSIAIFGEQFISQIVEGDSITITAIVEGYNGLTELTYDEGSSNLVVHKNKKISGPTVASIESINNQNWNGIEELEGRLVKVDNVTFVQSGTFSGNSNYAVKNEASSLIIRIDGDTDLVGKDIPDKPIDIIGVVSQFDNSSPFDSGYQLYPRTISDLMEKTITAGTLSESGFDFIQINETSGGVKLLVSVPGKSKISFSLVDMLGQKIKIATTKTYYEGEYKEVLNTDHLSEGLYLCYMTTEKEVIVKKIIIY